MVEKSRLSSAGYRAGAFAANHPRIVLTVVLLFLFVAVQGSVAADTDLAGTSNASSVDTGP